MRRPARRGDVADQDETARDARVRTAAAIDRLLAPEQVYTWLFSVDDFGDYGPQLTVAMFARGEFPPHAEVDAFAEQARAVF